MEYGLITIILLIFIYVIGRSKFRRTKTRLPEPQKNEAESVLIEASRGNTIVGLALIALLIVGLILKREKSEIIFFSISTLNLILHIIYFLRFPSSISKCNTFRF